MAISDITKIKLLRGLTNDLPDKLDDAEIGFTTNSGQLFIGYSGDVELSSRAQFPYSNLEILTENSTKVFADMHGALMKKGASTGYYSARLNQHGAAWFPVQVERDGILQDYRISQIDSVTAFINYAAFALAGNTIRIGKMILRHHKDNEAEPFLENTGMIFRRDLQTVQFRFKVAGPLNAPFLVFEYKNPFDEELIINFNVTRTSTPFYEAPIVQQRVSRIISSVKISLVAAGNT